MLEHDLRSDFRRIYSLQGTSLMRSLYQIGSLCFTHKICIIKFIFGSQDGVCEKYSRVLGNFVNCIKIEGHYPGGCGNCVRRGIHTLYMVREHSSLDEEYAILTFSNIQFRNAAPLSQSRYRAWSLVSFILPQYPCDSTFLFYHWLYRSGWR